MRWLRRHRRTADAVTVANTTAADITHTYTRYANTDTYAYAGYAYANTHAGYAYTHADTGFTHADADTRRLHLCACDSPESASHRRYDQQLYVELERRHNSGRLPGGVHPEARR